MHTLQRVVTPLLGQHHKRPSGETLLDRGDALAHVSNVSYRQGHHVLEFLSATGVKVGVGVSKRESRRAQVRSKALAHLESAQSFEEVAGPCTNVVLQVGLNQVKVVLKLALLCQGSLTRQVLVERVWVAQREGRGKEVLKVHIPKWVHR